MKRIPRAQAAALASLLLISGVTYAYPEWPQSLGLDFWSLPRLNEQLDRESRRAAELTDRDEAILKRVHLKNAAAEDVIDGTMCLRDAADLYVAINRTWPEALGQMRRVFPGATDEQSAARQAIAFVETTCNSKKRGDAGLVERLKREADAMGRE